MANIASVLKEEISRLARKEMRSETEKLKNSSAQNRAEIVALKRRVASLEQQLSRLGKTVSRASNNTEADTGDNATTKARFTVKGFKSLRLRLGLTAHETGALLGVSAQTIYSWEAGHTSPREKQLERIVALRGLGKRQVNAMLQEIAG